MSVKVLYEWDLYPEDGYFVSIYHEGDAGPGVDRRHLVGVLPQWFLPWFGGGNIWLFSAERALQLHALLLQRPDVVQSICSGCRIGHGGWNVPRWDFTCRIPAELLTPCVTDDIII